MPLSQSWNEPLSIYVRTPLASLKGAEPCGPLLFQAGRFDLWSLAGACALLLGVSVAACWLPRRAARVGPLKLCGMNNGWTRSH